MSQGSSSDADDHTVIRRKRSDGTLSPFWRRASEAIVLPLWVGAGFVLALVLLGVIGAVLGMAGISIDGINTSLLNTVFAALSYLLTAAIVIGVPIAVLRARVTRSDLGLARLPVWSDFLLALAGFVVYFVCSALLIYAATTFIPGFDAEQTQETGFSELTLRYEYILAFLTLVVIAPVAEEVLMRGYLYGKLRKVVPIVVAMVITGVLFGALHLQWNVALDVFALSLIMTSLREVSGSIWAGIFVHMMKNGLAFYLLFINTGLLHTIGG